MNLATLALLGGGIYLLSQSGGKAPPSGRPPAVPGPAKEGTATVLTSPGMKRPKGSKVRGLLFDIDFAGAEEDTTEEAPGITIGSVRAMSFSDSFDAWLNEQLRQGVQSPEPEASKDEWKRWTRHMMKVYKHMLMAEEGNRKGRNRYRDSMREGRQELRQTRRENRGAP